MSVQGTNLIPVHRERGSLRATFQDPQATLGSNDRCKNGVTVTLLGAEGVAYAWNRPEWAGNTAFSAPELESVPGMKPGAVANSSKLDNGLKAVQAAYGKQGFITARVVSPPSFNAARRLEKNPLSKFLKVEPKDIHELTALKAAMDKIVEEDTFQAWHLRPQ